MYNIVLWNRFLIKKHMPDSGLHTHENVKIVEQTDLQQNIAAEKGFGKYNHEL